MATTMSALATAYEGEMRSLVEDLIRVDTAAGNEAPAQERVAAALENHGFAVHTWTADADRLAELPTFPEAEAIDVADRPSVGGVIEFGDPDDGPTLVLNAHADVVPADPAGWSGDPFEPRWEGDRLVGRGAADMKSQIVACLFAARHLADTATNLDGRVVVESVAGEEEGGIGAAAAALDNPYPFERDAAIVTEPTGLRVVTATEGNVMKRLTVRGREAHAARKSRGVDVLPRFEAIRTAIEDLEAERTEAVTHPLYERFDIPWPVVIGRVRAGNWASNVPGWLEADMRIGVAPHESLDTVEAAFEAAVDSVVEEDDWLSEHPPTFERFGIQFASAEIDADEPVVEALQASLSDHDIGPTDPTGETYAADARHYIGAGIPTVVFGPGRIEEAHFPDESINWPDVLTAAAVLRDTARTFLAS